jgi:hypothetical protein
MLWTRLPMERDLSDAEAVILAGAILGIVWLVLT